MHYWRLCTLYTLWEKRRPDYRAGLCPRALLLFIFSVSVHSILQDGGCLHRSVPRASNRPYLLCPQPCYYRVKLDVLIGVSPLPPIWAFRPKHTNTKKRGVSPLPPIWAFRPKHFVPHLARGQSSALGAFAPPLKTSIWRCRWSIWRYRSSIWRVEMLNHRKSQSTPERGERCTAAG